VVGYRFEQSQKRGRAKFGGWRRAGVSEYLSTGGLRAGRSRKLPKTCQFPLPGAEFDVARYGRSGIRVQLPCPPGQGHIYEWSAASGSLGSEDAATKQTFLVVERQDLSGRECALGLIEANHC
jgi:hypothetical protein